MMTKEEKIKLVNSVPFWWQYIDFGDNVFSSGHQGGEGYKTIKNPTQQKLQRIHLPDDLQGKTVLDIGCNNGFFSFECEKRGAKVLAIERPNALKSDILGFKTAKRILNSNVEFKFLDIYDEKIKNLGKFDIVLALGLLYHLKSPYIALEIIRNLVKEYAIIETAFLLDSDEAMMEFVPAPHKNDHCCWYPTKNTLKLMAEDVGFKVTITDIAYSRVTIRGDINAE